MIPSGFIAGFFLTFLLRKPVRPPRYRYYEYWR